MIILYRQTVKPERKCFLLDLTSSGLWETKKSGMICYFYINIYINIIVRM